MFALNNAFLQKKLQNKASKNSQKSTEESIKKHFGMSVKKTLASFSLFGLLLSGLYFCLFNIITISAQPSGTNAINLYFPVVSKAGQKVAIRQAGTNNYIFDGGLTLDDEIRYMWKGVLLNTKYAKNPAVGGGYLKVYKNDDSTPDNFIADVGADNYPLKISTLASKLTPGQNNLLFVYYDHTGPAVPSTKVAFSFQFEGVSSQPQIKIIEPSAGTKFAKGVQKRFTLELQNFQLQNIPREDPKIGKLNIYHTEINPANFLATISSSTNEGGKQVVKFTNEILGDKFSALPDSLENKLIFVLTDKDGKALTQTQNSVLVTTNFQNTLNIGFPKIEITEPSQNRSTLVIDPDQKFILKIENFELLNQPVDLANIANTEGKGYLQIFVNNQPLKTNETNTTFTLKDLGVSTFNEKITVMVQLVNINNTTLSPEAKATIDVIIQPKSGDIQDASGVENNNWRLIIVFLTIILVVGGIALLITKG